MTPMLMQMQMLMARKVIKVMPMGTTRTNLI
jgi:hypothetical protein